MKNIAAVISLTWLVGCAPEPSGEAAFVELVHQEVRDALKDPDSAQFRDESAYIFPNQRLMCNGEVNAKNSYGGYKGYESYTYDGGRIAMADSDPESWQAAMRKCTDAIYAETAEIQKQLSEIEK